MLPALSLVSAGLLELMRESAEPDGFPNRISVELSVDLNESQFLDAAIQLEIDMIGAMAKFAHHAIRLGFREQGVMAMGWCVHLADEMTDKGTVDHTAAMIEVAQKLRGDGVLSEVFAAAAAMKKAT